jgi:magnesium-transporting ATPase (P-type)
VAAGLIAPGDGSIAALAVGSTGAAAVEAPGSIAGRPPISKTRTAAPARQPASGNPEARAHDSLLFVKGAPDVIINYCDRQELSDGTQAPLDRAFWEKKNEEIAIKGQRVLALAWLKDARIDEATFNAQGLTKELVLLGPRRYYRSAAR